MTADLFTDAERRMQKAIETLRQDISAIRAGRASAALVERITVEYYGAPTPINQVASISVPEAAISARAPASTVPVRGETAARACIQARCASVA